MPDTDVAAAPQLQPHVHLPWESLDPVEPVQNEGGGSIATAALDANQEKPHYPHAVFRSLPQTLAAGQTGSLSAKDAQHAADGAVGPGPQPTKPGTEEAVASLSATAIANDPPASEEDIAAHAFFSDDSDFSLTASSVQAADKPPIPAESDALADTPKLTISEEATPSAAPETPEPVASASASVTPAVPAPPHYLLSPADTSATAATFSLRDAILTTASEVATSAESLRQAERERSLGDDDAMVLLTVDDDPESVGTIPHAALHTQKTACTKTEPELELETKSLPVSVTIGGGWTILLMCLGIGLIACCAIIPQIDYNHRLAYEGRSLKENLESVQKQVAVNDEFLKKVMDDPSLAERLASRQMKTIRKGQKVLAVDDVAQKTEMSPFALVAVAKPAPLPAYRPVNGSIANLCNDSRSRLYVMGTAMTMVAAGLVMGFGSNAPAGAGGGKGSSRK